MPVRTHEMNRLQVRDVKRGEDVVENLVKLYGLMHQQNFKITN